MLALLHDKGGIREAWLVRVGAAQFDDDREAPAENIAKIDAVNALPDAPTGRKRSR